MSDFFRDDIGFETLYRLFDRVSRLCPNKPLFIQNKEFKNPFQVLTKILDHTGLPGEIKTEWSSLGTEFDGESWHEQKIPELTLKWHSQAIESTHIEYQESDVKTLDDLLNKVEPEHSEPFLWKSKGILFTPHKHLWMMLGLVSR